MARLSKKKLIENIEKSGGNISAIARSFGVSRTAIYDYCKRHDLWHVVEAQRDVMLDDAESELKRQALEEGNTTALIFMLKTIGKSRGYVERQELTGPDGASLQVEYVNDWRNVKDD